MQGTGDDEHPSACGDLHDLQCRLINLDASEHRGSSSHPCCPAGAAQQWQHLLANRTRYQGGCRLRSQHVATSRCL